MIDEKTHNGVLSIHSGKITAESTTVGIIAKALAVGCEVADNLIGMGSGGPTGQKTNVVAVICAGVNCE